VNAFLPSRSTRQQRPVSARIRERTHKTRGRHVAIGRLHHAARQRPHAARERHHTAGEWHHAARGRCVALPGGYEAPREFCVSSREGNDAIRGGASQLAGGPDRPPGGRVASRGRRSPTRIPCRTLAAPRGASGEAYRIPSGAYRSPGGWRRNRPTVLWRSRQPCGRSPNPERASMSDGSSGFDGLDFGVISVARQSLN
jgi:hypothetical protein